MKVDTKLPVYFTGQPKGNNGLRKIIASVPQSWDIPEYSKSDTEVAFTSRERYVWAGPANRQELIKQPHLFKMRTLNGELYRRMPVSLQMPLSFTEETLPVQRGLRFEAPNESISFRNMHNGFTEKQEFLSMHPLAPLYAHFGRQFRQQVDFLDNDTEKYWPKSTALQSLDSLSAKILSYDHDELQACLSLHTCFMFKFAFIDGELWCSSPAPVIAVEPNLGRAPSVRIHYTLSNIGMNSQINVCHFSLEAEQEAMAYAQSIVGQTGAALIDLRVPYLAGSISDLSFDHAGYDLKRGASALAIENYRFIKRNPRWLDEGIISASDVTCISASWAEAAKNNYVTGEMGDPEPWLDDNIRLWKKFGRRGYTHYFGYDNKASDICIERLQALSIDAPVSLNTRLFGLSCGHANPGPSVFTA